jgi:hypothetical protein
MTSRLGVVTFLVLGSAALLSPASAAADDACSLFTPTEAGVVLGTAEGASEPIQADLIAHS